MALEYKSDSSSLHGTSSSGTDEDEPVSVPEPEPEPVPITSEKLNNMENNMVHVVDRRRRLDYIPQRTSLLAAQTPIESIDADDMDTMIETTTSSPTSFLNSKYEFLFNQKRIQANKIDHQANEDKSLRFLEEKLNIAKREYVIELTQTIIYLRYQILAFLERNISILTSETTPKTFANERHLHDMKRQRNFHTNQCVGYEEILMSLVLQKETLNESKGSYRNTRLEIILNSLRIEANRKSEVRNHEEILLLKMFLGGKSLEKEWRTVEDIRTRVMMNRGLLEESKRLLEHNNQIFALLLAQNQNQNQNPEFENSLKTQREENELTLIQVNLDLASNIIEIELVFGELDIFAQALRPKSIQIPTPSSDVDVDVVQKISELNLNVGAFGSS